MSIPEAPPLCVMRQLAPVQSVDDLYGVLEELVVHTDVERSNERACFSCGLCLMALTVEFPDYDADIETTRLGMSMDLRRRCDDSEKDQLLARLDERFEPATPLIP